MFDSFVVVQFFNMITINILKFASSEKGKQRVVHVWAENYLNLV